MKSFRKIFLVGLLFAASLSFFFYLFLLRQHLLAPSIPVLGQIKQFSLIDQNGQRKDLNDFKKTISVVNFMFTTCSNICPMMTKNMSYVQSAVMIFDDVKLFSVSVNPEQDTPQVLQQYAKQAKAKPQKWFFLTGDREEIQRFAVESFKLGSIEEPVFHSDRFVLVDRKAQIRGYFEGTTKEGVQKLIQAIERVRKESGR